MSLIAFSQRKSTAGSDLSPLPRVLCTKHHGVAPQDVLEAAAHNLPLRPLGAPAVVLDLVHGQHKLPGEAVVAAAVADALEPGPVDRGLAGAEVGHGDGLRVGVHLAVLAVDERVALADLGGLRHHVEGRLLGAEAPRLVLVPRQRHHLVVAHVVVALPDAAAEPVSRLDLLVWGGGVVVLAQFGEQHLPGLVLVRVALNVRHHDVDWPVGVARVQAAQPEAVGAVGVDALGRELAVPLDGAGQTVRRSPSSLWLAALLEQMQPTGAGDGGGEVRVLPCAEQPQQNVNVVAALCQQARGRRVLAAPVSADVRVGKVPPPDGFRVHHVEDVAHAPLLQQQPAQLDVVRTVAQHVPDGEDVARAAQRPVHVDAVPEARGQRLLAHDVQAAQLGEAHHDLAVEVVLDADKDGVHARRLAVAGTAAAAAPLPAGLF
ncbi:hypothetical protein PoMZ_05226, partial [Pyricularia oryzae]